MTSSISFRVSTSSQGSRGAPPYPAGGSPVVGSMLFGAQAQTSQANPPIKIVRALKFRISIIKPLSVFAITPFSIPARFFIRVYRMAGRTITTVSRFFRG